MNTSYFNNRTSQALAVIVLLLLLALILSGCDVGTGTDGVQRQHTEAMVIEAHARVGMPAINNFTERRFAKYLLELRDSEVTTYSYYLDRNGGKHFLCQSVGYGIPYAVQFVNPERLVRVRLNWESPFVLPQPEPNGLFQPDALSATWVLCSDPAGEGVRPIYFEPELIVSPFRLD